MTTSESIAVHDNVAGSCQLDLAHTGRARWLLTVLAAAVALLGLPSLADAQQPCQVCFTGGPSVRVTPNTRVEFTWTTDVTWWGEVAVFDNPDGTGNPVVLVRDDDALGNPVASTQHTAVINTGDLWALDADTRYYFRVTTTDPNGSDQPFSTPTPLPSFFTGTQATGTVNVTPGADRADVSWDANVIGFGRVEYGETPAYGQTADDTDNVTGHAFTLTGLQPATTYHFRVSNRHAIDGDSLASSTGSFTTSPVIGAQFLQPLDQSTDPQHPVVNTGKNGRVIPIKVQLSQDGTAVTDQNVPGPVTIGVSHMASCDNGTTDSVESYADAGNSSAGTKEFGYDATIPAWTYNLDTRALGLVTGQCYRIDVSVNGNPVTNAFVVLEPTK